MDLGTGLASYLKPPSLSPDLKLRQGVIASVPSGGTASVQIGGSSVTVTNVSILTSVAPANGDTVWILQNGTDLLVIGKIGAPANPTTIPAGQVTAGTFVAGVLIPAAQVTSGQFAAGNFTFPSELTVNGKFNPTGDIIDFPETTRDGKIDLYGGDYLIGIRSNELYMKSWSFYGWEAPPGTWAMRFSNELDHARRGLKVFGDIKATLRMYCDDWYRSWNNTGWYNESHTGGWFMQDSTWIRVNGNKNVYTGLGMVRSDNRIVSDASNGATGFYIYSETDGNHRLFYNSSMGGPALDGWGGASIRGVANDQAFEAGRGNSSGRSVNNASNAWRDTGANIHYDNSDPRAKKEMRRLESQRAKVKGIKPIRFKWKDAAGVGDDPDVDHFGFSSDELPVEVTKKFPLFNHPEGQEDSVLVNPMGLLAMLWEAVRELDEEVELLKGKR